MEINTEDIIHYNIKYLFCIRLYKIEAFMIQYRLKIKLFEGLLWFSVDWSDHAQFISIGIYKIYFQFGPGIRP